MPRTAPDIPPPIDWHYAQRLYERLGSFAAVARELGCAAATVSKHLQARGVRRPSQRSGDASTLGIYVAWRRMIRACHDRAHPAFVRHGAEGAAVCARWQSYEAFREWALANGWRPGLGLVRITASRNFTPSNCRWAERSEVLRRRDADPRRVIEAFGESKGATEWTRDPRCRVGFTTLLARLGRGWASEDALSTPPKGQPKSRRRAPRSGEHSRAKQVNGAKAIDWRMVEQLVLEGGLSRSEVARRLRIRPSTVYQHFARNGIEVPRSRERRRIDEGPLYGSWCALRMRVSRCAASGRRRRPRIAPEWEDFAAFRAWARASGYRKGMCLVRLDLDGDWEPGNCRFVRRRDVIRYSRGVRDTRRPLWVVTAWGEDKGPMEWSRDRRCAVTAVTISRRLRAGWSPEDAIATPPEKPGATGVVLLPVTAFGMTKSVTEWSRDPRCAVTHGGLVARLKRGMAPEAAIVTPVWQLERDQP